MTTGIKTRSGLYDTSEIGRLKKVMLHRPGRELEGLTAKQLEQLGISSAADLHRVREDHDAFAGYLQDHGADVVYLADLVAEAIAEPEVRKEMVEQFLDEAGIDHHRIREMLLSWSSDMEDEELVEIMMAGVRKSDIRGFETGKLEDYLSWQSDDDPFLIDPMPGLYLVRDPFAVIGNGVSLHRMRTEIRRRETIFGKFIFKYHPSYKDAPKWYVSGEDATLEGGDILVLSPEVLAVGVPQRTGRDGAARLAHAVLSMSETFREVLAFELPKERWPMHLGTALDMVDRDKFTVWPGVLDRPAVQVYTLGADNHVDGKEEQGTLEDILKRHLHLDDVTLIQCGGVDAAGGRWSAGSSVLTVAPGEVVAWERDDAAVRALEKAGIRVYRARWGTLGWGRGGPWSMAMPFVREDV